MPVLAVCGAIMCATLIALAFVNPKSVGAHIGIAVILADGLAFAVLLTLIAITNRPRCVIPPMMRRGNTEPRSRSG
jgi:hypothetical protein